MNRTERPSSRPSEPAPRHLHLVRPPRTEPSEASPAAHRDPATSVPVQGTLPLLFTLPGGAPSRPRPPRRLHLVPSPLGIEDDDRPSGTSTPRTDLPDPRRWAGALVQAVVETRLGDRPASQLVRWTTREVYERIARQAGSAHGPSARGARAIRPVIRSLHVSEPGDGVVEACSLVHDGTRGRAVALRLEGIDGRWVCTALDLL